MKKLIAFLIAVALIICFCYYAERKEPYKCIFDVFGIELPKDSIVAITDFHYVYSFFPDMVVKLQASITEEEYTEMTRRISDLGIYRTIDKRGYLPPGMITSQNIDTSLITDMYNCMSSRLHVEPPPKIDRLIYWLRGWKKMTYVKYIVFTKDMDGTRSVYFSGM